MSRTPSPNRVEFTGFLVGRVLNVRDQQTAVLLRDVRIDGRRVSYYNVTCTPARAFDQIGSFEKGEITGNAELKRSGDGEVKLLGCRWIGLVNADVLPEPSPHAHMQRLGETTAG